MSASPAYPSAKRLLEAAALIHALAFEQAPNSLSCDGLFEVDAFLFD